MIDKKRFQRYTIIGSLVESGVLATFIVVSQHAGPHNTWFWTLWFTQMPGVLLMQFVSAPERHLPPGVRVVLYYGGVLAIQIATIAAAVALTLYTFARIRASSRGMNRKSGVG